MPMSRPLAVARRAARFCAAELAAIRALRPAVGARRAVAARVRANLELEGMEARLEELQRAHAAEREALEEWMREFHHQLHQGNLRIDRVEQSAPIANRVLAMDAFLAAVPPQDLLVSVIVTTRGRPELLRRALGSLPAQTHARWELVIAFDPEETATAEVVAAFDDPRVVALDRRGLARGAALNLCLERATGEVVTYLDDDNVMLPNWLKALAWAFARDPDLQLAYGALARQREHAEGDPTLPELELAAWDPERLRHENFIDQNVMGHRRTHPEARFDEQLTSMQDWEFLTRITRETTPRQLPVIAAVYCVGAPGRLTDHENKLEVAELIRARAARLRPPRVPA